jgi:hypothetical protein
MVETWSGFSEYPLGCVIYDLLAHRLEQVEAHLEATWLGTDKPWYGLATVPVLSKQHVPSVVWSQDKSRRVVAGFLPVRYLSHCLNGGGALTIERAENFRYLLLYRRFACQVDVLYTPSVALVRFVDEGDETVPGSGGEVVIAAGCGSTYGVEGWPELPWLPTGRNGQPLPGNRELVDVFCYLLHRSGEMEEGDG